MKNNLIISKDSGIEVATHANKVQLAVQLIILKNGDDYMKKILYTFLLFFLWGVTSFSQNILTQVDSIQVAQANIWGGISYDGNHINLTTMLGTSSGSQLHLVKYDTLLNQSGNPIQLTFNSDMPAGHHIADHKHLYINGYLYITFSTGAQDYLFLIKVDTAGNRIGNLVTVAQSATDTNDMTLLTDGTYIYDYYGPPGLTRTVVKYDLDLNRVGQPFTITAPAPYSQLGNGIFKDNRFDIFSGDEINHNLIVTYWNNDWTSQNPFSDTLIKSVNNEWNYFSTGVAYDSLNQLWYIGYHHFSPNDQPNHDVIYIAVFNNNFALLENQQISVQQYFRPHFLLLNNSLYVVYDGLGHVYIKKFKIQYTTTDVKQVKTNIPTYFNLYQNYPNPFNPTTTIEFSLPKRQHVTLKVFDVTGSEIKTLANSEFAAGKHSVIFDAKYLNSGVYFYRLTTPTFSQTKKMEMIK